MSHPAPSAQSGPPAVKSATQVVVRKELPLPAERVFALFSQGPELTRWFCDGADTETNLLGELHCMWLDEDGEPWERVGRFTVWQPPNLLTIEWYDVLTQADPAQSSSSHVLADGQSIVLQVPQEEPAEAAAEQTPDPEPNKPRETLQVAIAPYFEGSMVTVISPLLHDSTMRPEIQHDAVRAGWEAAFEALASLTEPATAAEP